MKGTIELVIQMMQQGKSSPTGVLVAGNKVTLKPVLAEVTSRLDNDQLLHLNFVLVGLKEFEASAKSFLETRGATFNFVPYEQQTCEAASAAKPETSAHSLPDDTAAKATPR